MFTQISKYFTPKGTGNHKFTVKKPGQPPKVLQVKSPGKDDKGDFTNAKKLNIHENKMQPESCARP